MTAPAITWLAVPWGGEAVSAVFVAEVHFVSEDAVLNPGFLEERIAALALELSRVHGRVCVVHVVKWVHSWEAVLLHVVQRVRGGLLLALANVQLLGLCSRQAIDEVYWSLHKTIESGAPAYCTTAQPCSGLQQSPPSSAPPPPAAAAPSRMAGRAPLA
eukprot:CAMPEP_0202338792 /NCGR_PEP_ID=MMETSP1126-20121109/924_1 /ASSEMBLY_ACC=CAM_ASM_000457 /TAXON_ID=3047 /ORGANISM="Dunaliella tertiolecta, Strain CCMP1320" /LENGTH=158 /DNA_ID=CAMNT_0048929237 /DNA_START=635 /DNA_END=1112 /DNA_ORIENTATION=-